MALATEVGGEPIVLRPERVAYLPRRGALLVADAHFGKAHTFRRLGVPVPAGTTSANLAALDRALAQTRASRIVFLGDLLHSRHALQAQLVEEVGQWRLRHAALEITLVRGNHDAHAGAPPPQWAMQVVEEPWPEGPLDCCHHPEPRAGRYVLAGHVHPAVRVGHGRHGLRLPCFHFGAAVGVLPAFGGFTGTHVVQPSPGDRVFVVADDLVREVPLPQGTEAPRGGTAAA